MACASDKQVNISLRAPDEFLSGLLSIAFGGCYDRGGGELDTFPEQEGCWYLVGVRGGAGRLTCALGCVLLSDGQAAAVSGESPLDVLYQGEGQLQVLCLKGSLPGKFLRREEKQEGAVYPGGGCILEDGLQQLKTEEARQGSVPPETASAIAYETLTRFYSAAAAAANKEEKLPQVVETALKILQQDFAFLDGIGDLAQRLEVSQEYLTRTFRDHVGMTPGKYLNQVRIEHAKLLLRGGHNVAFVADACGFANGNYFARVFRSMVGETPSAYAKENGGESTLPHPMLDSIYVL